MAQDYNPNNIPDFSIVEDQTAELMVDSATRGQYQGRVTFDVETHIVDGAAGWNGFNVRTRFFLGTEEDPKGELPQTQRSRNWTKYKNFVKATGATPTGDFDQDAELVQGQTFLGLIGHYTKGEGENAKWYNTINAYFRVGSREVGLTEKRPNGLDRSSQGRDMKAEAERMVPRMQQAANDD